MYKLRAQKGAEGYRKITLFNGNMALMTGWPGGMHSKNLRSVCFDCDCTTLSDTDNHMKNRAKKAEVNTKLIKGQCVSTC